MTTNQSILVIDDDLGIGEFISSVALSLGLRCTITVDANEFLEALTPETTLILLDLVMPYIDGIELLRLLGEQKCKAGFVLMSGMDRRIIESAEQLAGVLGLSIVGRLRKPFGLKKLEEVLIKAAVPASQPRIAAPRLNIEDDDLRQAVKEGRFVLHFQPQIEIATSQVTGVEGLVRWLHPEFGLIYPDHFIQRAEKLGLIDEVGLLVLRLGLSQLSRIVTPGQILPSLSLNVSSDSLRDLRLPDIVAAMLQEFSIPSQRLILEVTESSIIEDLPSTLDVLTRLRLKGIRLSIDDFGTGYSMLQQLRRIPANELKIDRSFIGRMLGDYGDRIVVQKTIEIGHDLGMQVIAEGVETKEQLDFLRANHCDVAQGYYFCRPRPLAVLLSWMNERQSPAKSPPLVN